MNLVQDTKNSESLQTIVTFDSIKRWIKNAAPFEPFYFLCNTESIFCNTVYYKFISL